MKIQGRNTKVCILYHNASKKFLVYLRIIKMSETTKEYFEREKESRFTLMDYLDSEQWIERVEIVDKLIWEWQIDDLLEWTEEDWETVLDVDETNRDAIDDRVKNYLDPLSIERRVRVNPRDPSQVESYQDSKYKILITYGWPNVFFEIDFTAELHLYRWGEHYSRDFWADFADKLLSFYWLE